MDGRFPNLVPFDAAGTRQDTVVLLVGTAREHGLVVRHHLSKNRDGFLISDALADLIEEDTEPEADDTEPDDTNQTSGNRAAKKSRKKGKTT
jgi:hypothetical protein